jgi:hypothetical protein
MHEDELRAIIRDVVARHLGQMSDADGRARRAGPTSLDRGDGRTGDGDGRAGCPNPALTSWTSHHSHGRFVFLAPTDPDAPCVVEPQVRCHHCGFCQSYGN